MSAQTIEIVSVKDGKFHRPDDTLFNGKGNDFRDARLMRCGRSLVPLNFFETIVSADRHTGGRLDRYICQQCEKKVSHLWRVPEVLKNGTPVQPANEPQPATAEGEGEAGHHPFNNGREIFSETCSDCGDNRQAKAHDAQPTTPHTADDADRLLAQIRSDDPKTRALARLVAADNCNYGRDAMRSEGLFEAARRALSDTRI